MQNVVLSSKSVRAFAPVMIAVMVGTALAVGGPVRVEEVAYRGWKGNVQLSNGDITLIATLEVGPRIISYQLKGGRNVFKEYDDQLGRSGESEWMIRGGHRLWTGPEDTTRTYALDNVPITYETLRDGVRLTSPADARSGLRKEIDVTLGSEGSRVRLVHRITNISSRATELAPWALSVMAPGGMEIIPLPPRAPHPGSPQNAASPADFGPNQPWVLWPYTRLSDPRWKLGDQFLTLSQRPSTEPTQLGLLQRGGRSVT